MKKIKIILMKFLMILGNEVDNDNILDDDEISNDKNNANDLNDNEIDISLYIND